jgi:hypothetical protein
VKRQTIEFVLRNNGVNTKTSGIGVGQFLAITFPNKYDQDAVMIFNTLTGKPLVDLRFASTKAGIDDAVKVAEWLVEMYGEFLEVPTAKGFEDADIIDICQWTVPNGIQIRIAFELLDKVKKGIEFVTAAHVARAYELAEPEVKKWLGYVRPR